MGILRYFGIAVIAALVGTSVTHGSTVLFDPVHAVDPSVPDIAAPVDFRVHLVDETRVEFSWNPVLLDGSSVDYFRIWDRARLLVETSDNRWQLDGIDHNKIYDFSVSAVTINGEETRRSSRVYYDLPAQDPTAVDAYNHYLPPLENLQATVVDSDSVRLTWDPAPAHWSWAEPSDYTYGIYMQGHQVDVVSETAYTYTGLEAQGQVWITIYAFADGGLSSRQPNIVLVDTREPAGTVFNGIAGFNSLYGLNADVYSSTAAELFWSYSGSSASHVYIDGRLVARMTEGNSLFVENLPPGERLLVSVGEGWPYEESPPHDWPLLHDYPLMHVWIETPPRTNGDTDQTIEPVTGLYSGVYSGTAAEVFWDRSDIALTRYRLYLNDVFQQETDAVSWFLDDLAEATTYTVGVAAVDDEGLEAPIQQVSFTTRGSSDTEPLTCQIDGLSVSVYSTTAAEVMWNRQSAGQQYRVSLDDEPSSTTDSVSWFLQDLAPGSQHQFAIRRANEACLDVVYTLNFQTNSAPDSSTVEPPETSSIISHDNYIDIIREVFQVYVGNAYTDPLVAISEFSIVGRHPDGTFFDVFACESGRFSQNLNVTSSNAGTFYNFIFDDCVDESVTRHGTLSGQNGSRGLTFSATDISITQSDGLFSDFAGAIQKWNTQSAYFDQIHSFDTTDVAVNRSVYDVVDLSISDMETSFAYGRRNNGLDEAWLRGAFSVRLGAAEHFPLAISTPVAFFYALNTRTDGFSIDGLPAATSPISTDQRNAWTFTQGQLSVEAEDGSALLLDADNGNPDTVIITIRSHRGEEMVEQPWSLWLDDLRFDDYTNLTD